MPAASVLTSWRLDSFARWPYCHHDAVYQFHQRVDHLGHRGPGAAPTSLMTRARRGNPGKSPAQMSAIGKSASSETSGTEFPTWPCPVIGLCVTVLSHPEPKRGTKLCQERCGVWNAATCADGTVSSVVLAFASVFAASALVTITAYPPRYATSTADINW